MTIYNLITLLVIVLSLFLVSSRPVPVRCIDSDLKVVSDHGDVINTSDTELDYHCVSAIFKSNGTQDLVVSIVESEDTVTQKIP